MMKLDKIYTEGWMKSRGDPKGARYRTAQVMSKTFIRDLRPKSVLDLGCGACNFTNALHQRGCDVTAVDGSDHAKKMMDEGVQFICFNLENQLKLDRNFDLVLCLEVLEHIDAKYEKIVLSNIISHVRKYTVITAAKPGQSGLHHINCKLKEYWVKQLNGLGLKRCEDLEACWKKEWMEEKVSSCYVDNLIVWENPRMDSRFEYHKTSQREN